MTPTRNTSDNPGTQSTTEPPSGNSGGVGVTVSDAVTPTAADVMSRDEFYLELAILVGRFWTRIPERFRAGFMDELEGLQGTRAVRNLVRVIVHYRVPVEPDERELLARMLVYLGRDLDIVESFVVRTPPEPCAVVAAVVLMPCCIGLRLVYRCRSDDHEIDKHLVDRPLWMHHIGQGASVVVAHTTNPHQQRQLIHAAYSAAVVDALAVAQHALVAEYPCLNV